MAVPEKIDAMYDLLLSMQSRLASHDDKLYSLSNKRPNGSQDTDVRSAGSIRTSEAVYQRSVKARTKMELPGHRNSRSTNLYTIDGVSASLNATFLNKASGLADLIKDATKKSMILCGHITPPEDKGKYLAYAAIAQCPRISKTADESDVITIQEFYRFTLSGTANGQGKIAEMGAIQQVAKNYTQLRKEIGCVTRHTLAHGISRLIVEEHAKDPDIRRKAFQNVTDDLKNFALACQAGLGDKRVEATTAFNIAWPHVRGFLKQLRGGPTLNKPEAIRHWASRVDDTTIDPLGSCLFTEVVEAVLDELKIKARVQDAEGNETIHVSPLFLGYVHVVADTYIDGGAGPGVKKIPGVEKHDMSQIMARMQAFSGQVVWETVQKFSRHESERDLVVNVGRGAFPDNEIAAVPLHLQHIVNGSPGSSQDENGEGEEEGQDEDLSEYV